MLTLIMSITLLQGAACGGEAGTLLVRARALAEELDLATAADVAARAATQGCEDAAVGAAYLRGLLRARAAYAAGGSPESLEPVRDAIAALDALGANGPGPAQIARTVLSAASAASQSERDEMRLYIEHALFLEAQQFGGRLSGAPLVTAHEIAGDLWMQVHRHDDAQRAYARAADVVGRTARVQLGLARAAASLLDTKTACVEYAGFVTWWADRRTPTAEVEEASRFLEKETCTQ